MTTRGSSKFTSSNGGGDRATVSSVAYLPVPHWGPFYQPLTTCLGANHSALVTCVIVLFFCSVITPILSHASAWRRATQRFEEREIVIIYALRRAGRFDFCSSFSSTKHLISDFKKKLITTRIEYLSTVMKNC